MSIGGQGDLTRRNECSARPATLKYEDSYQIPIVSFLTAAAPNLGAIATSQPTAAGTVTGMLATRAARVLAAAAAHGHRRLVLGAWGCGVFRNDPAVVAEAFAGQLARTQGHFDHVVFAVLDRQRGTPTHAAFTRALRRPAVR